MRTFLFMLAIAMFFGIPTGFAIEPADGEEFSIIYCKYMGNSRVPHGMNAINEAIYDPNGVWIAEATDVSDELWMHSVTDVKDPFWMTSLGQSDSVTVCVTLTGKKGKPATPVSYGAPGSKMKFVYCVGTSTVNDETTTFAEDVYGRKEKITINNEYSIIGDVTIESFDSVLHNDGMYYCGLIGGLVEKTAVGAEAP